MTSPTTCKGLPAQALGEAEAADIKRCLRPSCRSLATYQQHHSVADICSEFEFELEHMGGDADLPFMRP